MADYESVLVVKQEVFVYKIPPRSTNRGYRAADWNLQSPDWTGRMRLVSKGNECIMKLEDKTTGELFAKCPIDKYPGIAVEAVADSSRYFVLRIQDDNGRSAFIGFGFADRGDSFDLNVALQDHFKWVEKTEKIEKEEKQENKPQLDLSFKEGQTITINMKIGQKTTGTTRPKSKATGSGILPPPPSGNAMKIAPPPGRNSSPVDASSTIKQENPNVSNLPPTTTDSSELGLLLDLDPLSTVKTSEPAQNEMPDLWNDFTTAGTIANAPNPVQSANNQQASSNSGNWVQF